MYFETFSEFIAMGRHGPFVWSAYGISTALVLGLLVYLRGRRKTVIADIKRQIRREEADEQNSAGTHSD